MCVFSYLSVSASLILLLSVPQSKPAYLSVSVFLYLCMPLGFSLSLSVFLTLYPRILSPKESQDDSMKGGARRAFERGDLPTPLSAGARGDCAFKRGRAHGPGFPARLNS